MDTTEQFFWTLTPEEFIATKEKVEKLNQRAIKRGWTGRLELIGHREEIERSTAIGPIKEIVYKTRIAGDPPSYDGWRLLASVDFLETGMIVNTAPGVEKVDRSLVEQGKCDHCKRQRDRVKCYLVGDDSGTQLQVGSTCLKDFLGWHAKPVWLDMDDVRSDVDGFLSGGYWPRQYATESVLAAAWATIKLDGYVRSGDVHSTRDTVGEILNPPAKLARALEQKYGALQDESADIAKQTRDFILSDDFNGDNEYVANMKVAISSDVVSSKHFGLVVSAPQTWARWQERTLIREREKTNYVDEFLGSERVRLRGLRVQVKAIRFIESDYGATTLYTMVTDTGHLVKWFASDSKLGESKTDDWFTIDGTVKAHEIWQGQKSTVLTRCKIK